MKKQLLYGKLHVVLAFMLLSFTYASFSQTLLWSDEFNTPQLDQSVWTYAIGDGCDQGICGWGNQELQTYTNNNTSIVNGQLVITARRETVNGKDFTSARLLTKDKVSVKYGRVEASIKLPDMNNGLWPAFWMLGDGNRWPYTGEIDIMEAGFNATSTDANAVAKANVFWRAEDAGVTGNLQYGNEDDFKYDAPAESGNGLNDDFFVYRVDWTPTSLTAYVLQTDANNNPIESTAYEVFSIPNEPTFQSEFFSGDNFYILLNLAVGGWLPFSEPENNAGNVTALPTAGSEAQMLVEYVRVYDIGGIGEVNLGNVEEEVLGSNGFGIFADGTSVDSQLDFGIDAELFLWEDAAAPEIQLNTVSSSFGSEAYEITFPANQWAGMTLNSSDVLNLSNYSGGSLRLKVSTTSQEPFRIAAESAAGSAGVDFAAGEEKFGLLRDGQWHDVEIPIELVVSNFQQVYSPFVISNVENSNPSTSSQFLIDEIHFSSQPASGFSKYVPVQGNYGLFTSSPVADQLVLGTDGDVFVWEQTLLEGPTETYNGQPALSYVTNNLGWFGLGITADQLHDLSAFEGGNLHLAMKSSSQETLNLSINIGLALGTIVFEAGNDPYGFVRDGQWHELTIPLADFTGVNLSGVETLLSINGTGNISDLALSDIYFEYTGTNQPVLTSIDVSPTNATINQGQTQQFSAQGFDQNGDPISTSVSWSAAGGTINSNGLFTGSDNGTFIISATSEGLTGTASITVNEVISGISIPGTIEVEDYDNYYDTSAGNSGGAYRNDDVDIEATGDATGAYNVGWTAAGEWLEYTIYASASSALYDISARLASPSGTGQLHVEIDGVDVSGPINAPNTGSWQSYTTVTVEDVSIATGSHVMRVVIDAAGFNINYLEASEVQAQQPVLTSIMISPSTATIDQGQTQQFSAQGLDQNGNPMSSSVSWSTDGGSVDSNGLYTGSSAGSYTVTATSGAVNGTAQVIVNSVSTGWTLPGRVEAENFNDGGQNVGYYDTSAGNTGGAFRPAEDVDIEGTGDAEGLYNVGWTEAGEWLEYDVSANASSFDLSLRAASATGGGSLRVEIDGVDVSGPISVPNTGGWQVYESFSVANIAIAPGNHTMRIHFISPGINLNYVDFTENTSTPTGCTQSGPNGDYTVEISEDSSDPTLTFVPGYAGVGNPTTLLYYGTDPNGPYPGYGVSPNTPFQISASSGQTIYFYYTYSVPEGGERNSAGDKHSFTVGNCSTGSRQASTPDEVIESSSLLIYPNPAKDVIHLQLNQHYAHLELLDITGRQLSNKMINTTQIPVDISSLKSGHYLIRLSGPDGTITKRFFKQD